MRLEQDCVCTHIMHDSLINVPPAALMQRLQSTPSGSQHMAANAAGATNDAKADAHRQRRSAGGECYRIGWRETNVFVDTKDISRDRRDQLQPFSAPSVRAKPVMLETDTKSSYPPAG